MGQHGMYYTDLEMLFLLNYKAIHMMCTFFENEITIIELQYYCNFKC